MTDDDPSAYTLVRAQLRALSRRAESLGDPNERAELEQEIRDTRLALARLEQVRPGAPAWLLWRTLVGPPDDLEAYRVSRWFLLDGERAEPGEIIAPRRGFWQGHRPSSRLIGTGTLALLDRPMMAWECPCHRFWSDRADWLAHGCSEPPAADDLLSPSEEAQKLNASRSNFVVVYARVYAALHRELRRKPKLPELAGVMGMSIRTLTRLRSTAAGKD